MYTKLLAIVTLAAAISAHQFPTSYFFIQNDDTKLVLDVDGASTEPGAKVILWRRKSSGFENQLWKFNATSGWLINKNSGLILEAPRSADGAVFETEVPLRQAKIMGNGDPSHQQWATSDMEIFPEHIRWLCITGDKSFAYLAGCGSSSEQKWSFQVAD